MLRTILLVMTACLVQTEAHAQSSNAKTFITEQPCNTFEEMKKTLTKYGETPLFVGEGITIASPNKNVYKGGMIFFVNQETGTWSHISIFADGMSCMVSNGRDFLPYEN